MPTDREKAASTLVQRLVDTGIRGVGPLDPAVEVAEKAFARAGTVEGAVDRVVAQHVRTAAGNGFVTGLGGFLTLPVALPANLVGFYALATRMVAATAHLRGHDLQDAAVRTAVLETLVDAGARMPVAGRAGGLVTRMLTRRLPAPVQMAVDKGVGFRLLGQMSARSLGRLGRGVPLAGGVMGAGADAYLLHRIGGSARERFPATGRALGHR